MEKEDFYPAVNILQNLGLGRSLNAVVYFMQIVKEDVKLSPEFVFLNAYLDEKDEQFIATLLFGVFPKELKNFPDGVYFEHTPPVKACLDPEFSDWEAVVNHIKQNVVNASRLWYSYLWWQLGEVVPLEENTLLRWFMACYRKILEVWRSEHVEQFDEAVAKLLAT